MPENHTGRHCQQVPLLHLQSMIVTNHGVSLSVDAIEACCKCGIPIVVLTDHGDCYATGLTATVITRQDQIRAYDNGRGYFVSVAVARAKIGRGSVWYCQNHTVGQVAQGSVAPPPSTAC